MSYQEKKNYVSLFCTLFIFGFYCLYVFRNYQEEIFGPTLNFSVWGAIILILIPISIVAKIIITIIFTIINRITTNEIEPSFSDELDKLIELKATRNSHYVFVLGFILSMVALVIDRSPSTMFMILLFSGFVSEIVGVGTQLYLYRRGV
ncbi:MAG: hypothetical protein ACE3L7_30410 [Candidatus Pristimantibacillus sp.]